MFKTNFRFNPKTWALPLAVSFDHSIVRTAVQISLLCFGFQMIYINVPKVDEELDALKAPQIKSRKQRRAEFKAAKATKAYADERQKAPRNRKRKPSKKMAGVYQLKGV